MSPTNKSLKLVWVIAGCVFSTQLCVHWVNPKMQRKGHGIALYFSWFFRSIAIARAMCSDFGSDAIASVGLLCVLWPNLIQDQGNQQTAQSLTFWLNWNWWKQTVSNNNFRKLNPSQKLMHSALQRSFQRIRLVFISEDFQGIRKAPKETQVKNDIWTSKDWKRVNYKSVNIPPLWLLYDSCFVTICCSIRGWWWW